MANRVPVITPEGKTGFVDESQLGQLPEGARVLTAKEQASQRADAAYDKKSTVEKVTSLASIAGPLPFAVRTGIKLAQGKGEEIAPSLPPTVEAYAQGVSSGFTGGLASVGMQEAVRLAGGDAAAKAYGQNAEDVKKAHEGLYTGGQIAGFLGGASAGTPFTRIGGLAENFAARGLGGLAERGVVGRAAATAGELGVRGGIEGALYGAAQQVTDDMLGDHELTRDKLFAATGLGALGGAVGGAVLGGAGSIGKSAVSGAAGSVRGALARVGGRAEQAAEEAATKGAAAIEDAKQGIKATADEATAQAVGETAKATKAIADATGTKGAQEASAGRGILADMQTVEGQKGIAYDQAAKALSGGGLSPTKPFKRAMKYLPNGMRDVGETVMRRGIIDADEGLVNAARHGTPEELVPRIAAQLDSIGPRLGEIADSSGGKVPALDVFKAIDDVVTPLQKKAGFGSIANSVERYGVELFDKLGIHVPEMQLPKDMGQYPPAIQQQLMDAARANHAQAIEHALSTQDVPVQRLLEQRKALDELVHRPGMALDASAAIEEKRVIRAKMEDLVEHAIGEADVKGAAGAEYKALKKDYFALKVAHDIATDSAARASKNASLGLTDKMIGTAVGLASHAVGVPGFIAGPAAAAASKQIRTRGNAAAAVLLYRMANMGTLTKAVQGVDEMIGRASRGLLAAPKVGAVESMGAPRARATQAMKEVAAFQADPAAFIEHVARNTDALGAISPDLAGGLSKRMTDAMAFMASKIPPAAAPDPFHPNATPHLTDAETHELASYHFYVEKPSRFFEEVAKGKITPQGAEVAKALMPRAFAELQARTAEGLSTLLAQGREPPYEQRRRLGSLLDFPAVPEQDPKHMKLLQVNVQNAINPGTNPGAAPALPKRQITSKSQPSALDRLDAHSPGAR